MKYKTAPSPNLWYLIAVDLSSLEPFKRRVYTIMFVIGWLATVVAWIYQTSRGTTTPATLTMLAVSVALLSLFIVLTWLPSVPMMAIDIATVCFVAGIGLATISLNFYSQPELDNVAFDSIYIWLPVMYIFVFFITKHRLALGLSIALWALFVLVSLPYLIEHSDTSKGHLNTQFHLMSVIFIAIFYFFASHQQHLRLTELNRDELARLANTDNLTKAANRRRMTELLHEEYERFTRYQHVFSIILIDVDYFKQFNDNYGHDVGDDILRALATNLQEIVRSVDTLARWGGEEFMVMLPETDFDEAMIKAELIREHIASTALIEGHHITLSCGVTEVITGDTLDSIFKRADKALYQAKEAGRNQVKGLRGETSEPGLHTSQH